MYNAGNIEEHNIHNKLVLVLYYHQYAQKSIQYLNGTQIYNTFSNMQNIVYFTKSKNKTKLKS